MLERVHKKKVLITGGTSGLGLELAKLFLDNGAEVYATGRRMPESLSTNSGYHFIMIDFSDLKQVYNAISNLLSAGLVFDLVVNNAGVLSPSEYTLTSQGIEYTLQVNLLSHLLICDIVLSSLPDGETIRLAFVTSPVYKYVKPTFRFQHNHEYKAFRTYSETKYYLLLAGSYLKKTFPSKNIQIVGLDPGTFSSGIYRTQRRWFHRMYLLAAPFMRSSGKVARDLYKIMVDQQFSENMVWHRSGRRSDPFPALNIISEKFLLACHKAIKVVR